MIAIEFPAPDFKIVRENGRDIIFDRYRKKNVILTPEEWVRQNFLNYLIKTLGYPPSLIGIEKEIRLGELKKRCDIVIYNRETKPWMIIECKEMNVQLTQAVLEQIIRYHMVLPTAFLVVTNGVNTYCCQHIVEEQQWRFIDQLPLFNIL